MEGEGRGVVMEGGGNGAGPVVVSVHELYTKVFDACLYTVYV